MPYLIDLDVAFYMHLTWQFDSAHVKCDVNLKPGLSVNKSPLILQRILKLLHFFILYCLRLCLCNGLPNRGENSNDFHTRGLVKME